MIVFGIDNSYCSEKYVNGIMKIGGLISQFFKEEKRLLLEVQILISIYLKT